jgi:hypothetical protein
MWLSVPWIRLHLHSVGSHASFTARSSPCSMPARAWEPENGIGCPYSYPHPNPPVPAGMGRVRVHLKLNGWVRMGAHIYYTMALRAPSRLTASTKLGLGLRTPKNRLRSTISMFLWSNHKLKQSYEIPHFRYLVREFPGGYGWVPPIVGHRRVDTGGYTIWEWGRGCDQV